MICKMCNTEIPDNSTSCFVCGNIIKNDNFNSSNQVNLKSSWNNSSYPSYSLQPKANQISKNEFFKNVCSDDVKKHMTVTCFFLYFISFTNLIILILSIAAGGEINLDDDVLIINPIMQFFSTSIIIACAISIHIFKSKKAAIAFGALFGLRAILNFLNFGAYSGLISLVWALYVLYSVFAFEKEYNEYIA
ncbi:MAG: hypothetical protein IJ763_08685 [Lachnospiraceae bacterium]|nr:hypothetical protein [Lachnospiraceae bacterium]